MLFIRLNYSVTYSPPVSDFLEKGMLLAKSNCKTIHSEKAWVSTAHLSERAVLFIRPIHLR
jgi:hypothetical protein